MKDKLFEPYYKLGFTHFVNKRVLHLKKPRKDVQRFYLVLIGLIITISIIFG